MTSRRLLPLLAALAFAVAACGTDGRAPATAPATPAGMIGPAGGAVSGPNGARVDVPAGALSTNAAIAVAQSSAGAPAMPAGFVPFGPLYAFTPHGQTFAAAVTVAVPFDPATVPAGATPVLFKTNASNQWERVDGATIASGVATAQVNGFSWFALGNVPPRITQPPQPVTVVAPAAATFSVVAEGTPPLGYQWQRSDDGGASFVDVSGGDASYSTPATIVGQDDGDLYRVVVANLEGSVTTPAVRLTVTNAAAAPVITQQPQDATVVEGAAASFSVQATGTPAPTFQWQRDGSDINGATQATYTTPATTVAADDGATFRVVVTNAAGTVTSATATLSVTAAPPPPPPPGGRRLTGGISFSVVRSAGGALYSWGSDGAGTLGDGVGDSTLTTPAPIATVTDARDLSSRAQSTVFVRADGSAWGFGYNGFGQLGDGTNLSREEPVRILTGVAQQPTTNIVAVAAGGLHTLLLRADGTVLATGRNAVGQLGDGTTAERRRADPVPGLTGVVAIAAGNHHSLALRQDGTVWAWGWNASGQLGTGDRADRLVPTQVVGLADVRAIVAGENFSLALVDTSPGDGLAVGDAEVWGWGYSFNGQLGCGVQSQDRPTPAIVLDFANERLGGVAAIASGHDHSFAIKRDGSLWGWGVGDLGQLGDGFGFPFYCPQVMPMPTTMVEIGAGADQSFGIDAAGNLWGWGFNNAGQVGDGTTVNRLAPVRIGTLNLN